MRKEYDLINELGPQNWLDVVAGEAVILGYSINDPELVAKGTELNVLIRRCCYDDDCFGKVEAYGEALRKEIETKRIKQKMTFFIDDLFVGEVKSKSHYEWEYDFICADRGYEILMILPVYYDKSKLSDPVRMIADKKLRSMYDDPSFESYRKEEVDTVFESQTFHFTKYFDEKGRLLRRSVDFNHEGVTARGWFEHFYFEDFALALGAWQEIKDAFISNQKK